MGSREQQSGFPEPLCPKKTCAAGIQHALGEKAVFVQGQHYDPRGMESAGTGTTVFAEVPCDVPADGKG